MSIDHTSFGPDGKQEIVVHITPEVRSVLPNSLLIADQLVSFERSLRRASFLPQLITIAGFITEDGCKCAVLANSSTPSGPYGIYMPINNGCYRIGSLTQEVNIARMDGINMPLPAAFGIGSFTENTSGAEDTISDKIPVLLDRLP